MFYHQRGTGEANSFLSEYAVKQFRLFVQKHATYKPLQRWFYSKSVKPNVLPVDIDDTAIDLIAAKDDATKQMRRLVLAYEQAQDKIKRLEMENAILRGQLEVSAMKVEL